MFFIGGKMLKEFGPRIKAVTQRSKRSSGTKSGGGEGWISTMTDNSHSEMSLALNPLQFKKKPYSSRNSILNLNLFWEDEILLYLLQVVKSSQAFCKAPFQSAGSAESGSACPKACIWRSIPLSFFTDGREAINMEVLSHW